MRGDIVAVLQKKPNVPDQGPTAFSFHSKCIALIGESGSGKTLFLRALFDQSTRLRIENPGQNPISILSQDLPPSKLISTIRPRAGETIASLYRLGEICRRLLTTASIQRCPSCGSSKEHFEISRIPSTILSRFEGTLVKIKGCLKDSLIPDQLQKIEKLGYRVTFESSQSPSVLLDHLTIGEASLSRLHSTLSRAYSESPLRKVLEGIIVEDQNNHENQFIYGFGESCPTCGVLLPSIPEEIFRFQSEVTQNAPKDSLCQLKFPQRSQQKYLSFLPSLILGGFSLEEILSSSFNDLSMKIQQNPLVYPHWRSLLPFLKRIASLQIGHLSFLRRLESLSQGELSRLSLAFGFSDEFPALSYLIDELPGFEHPLDTAIRNEFFSERTQRGAVIVYAASHSERAPREFQKAPCHFFSYNTPVFQELTSVEKKTSLPLILSNEWANEYQVSQTSLPFSSLVQVIGPSGCGKTRFLTHAISEAVKQRSVPTRLIELLDLDRETRNSPLGSFLDLLTPLADLFSKLPLAKSRGIKGKDFFKRQSLDSHELLARLAWKNHTFDQILSSPLSEISSILQNLPKITPTLSLLQNLGLAHLSLGQPLQSLGQGELRRIRIIQAVSQPRSGAVYLLNRPFFQMGKNIQPLIIQLLMNLVAQENLVVIEGDQDVVWPCSTIRIEPLKRKR